MFTARAQFVASMLDTISTNSTISLMQSWWCFREMAPRSFFRRFPAAAARCRIAGCANNGPSCCQLVLTVFVTCFLLLLLFSVNYLFTGTAAPAAAATSATSSYWYKITIRISKGTVTSDRFHDR